MNTSLSRKPGYRRLAAAALLAACAAPVAAQSWTGNTSGNWNTASNWSTLPVSSQNTVLIFGAAGSAGTALTNNLASPFLLNSLVFNNASSAYVIGGNTLDFRTSSTTAAPSIGHESANAVTLNTPLIFTNILAVSGGGSGGLHLNGAISGAGGLIVNSAGPVTLGSSANTFAGNISVLSTALNLGTGQAIPAGRNITLGNSAAQFNTNGLSNTLSTAIGTLSIGGGTFRVPSGNGDYFLNQLTSGGGTVNFSGSGTGTGFKLHFSGAGAAITTTGGTNTWIGAGLSRIQNDTAAPLPINVAGVLDAGIILSSAGTNPNFIKLGSGFLRLLNTGNTGNITVSGGYIITSDLSTNVGGGAFGTLGTGIITLSNGGLAYEGASAVSAKPLTLATLGNIQVSNPTASLTLSGVISESAAGADLNVLGSGVAASPSTLTLSGANSYTGFTAVNNHGILAIPTIANGGINSPLGASTNAPANLSLGAASSRGTLALTGTNANYSTDRGVTVLGNYLNGHGGAINVANPATTLTVSGQISGAGSLIKSGPGTLVLSNATNNYSLHTKVEGGRLRLGSGTAIPPGGTVILDAGTEFDIGAQTNTPATAPGTVRLDGATIRFASNNTTYHISNLHIQDGGGTINATAATGNTGLAFSHIDVDANATFSGANTSYISNVSGRQVNISVDNGATLTSALSLSGTGVNSFSLFGSGGTLHLTNPPAYSAVIDVADTLRMDHAPAASSGFTINLVGGPQSEGGGVFEYTGPTASTPAVQLGILGGTVNVTNAATTLTLSNAVGGPADASLFKTGPGTLVLGAAGTTIPGGLFINQGRLRLGSAGDLASGTNVTVASGAEFDTNGRRVGALFTETGVMTLNGGTLRIPSGGERYYVNQLVTGTAGGTINTTGSAGAALVLTGDGAAVHINGNTSWTGPSSSAIVNSSHGELPITIAPGITLTSSASLVTTTTANPDIRENPFRITGGGTLHLTGTSNGARVLVTAARLRLNNIRNLEADDVLNVTLDNGILDYAGSSTTETVGSFAIAGGGGTLEISNPATTLNFAGLISGPGKLIKSGPGRLTLTNTSNVYSGGIDVERGTLEVSSDAHLGAAKLGVGPLGIVRYTANTTTSRTINLLGGVMEVASGQTLALSGATVGGGFLRGPGSFAFQDGTSLFGTTTAIGTTITQSGTVTLSNFTNNAQFVLAPGGQLNWNGGTNTSAGRMTVTGNLLVNNFLSNGQINIEGAGRLSNATTPIVLGAGSTTYIGVVGVPGSEFDLNGQTLELRGGLLVNNGTVLEGTTNIYFGGLAKGSGAFNGPVNLLDGGRFSPGNSPGSVTTGSSTWNSGGHYLVEIADALSGAGSGWDLWNINGTLDINAASSTNGRFTISLASLSGDLPGPAANFDPSRDYSWTILHAEGGISGFADSEMNLDLSGFRNDIGAGHFSISTTPTDVIIHFSAVPEPGTLSLVLISTFAVLHRRQRHINFGRRES